MYNEQKQWDIIMINNKNIFYALFDVVTRTLTLFSFLYFFIGFDPIQSLLCTTMFISGVFLIELMFHEKKIIALERSERNKMFLAVFWVIVLFGVSNVAFVHSFELSRLQEYIAINGDNVSLLNLKTITYIVMGHGLYCACVFVLFFRFLSLNNMCDMVSRTTQYLIEIEKKKELH